MSTERPRYYAVQIDRRTGAHQLLNVPSAGYDACIFAFQSLGPCPCESPFQRVTFIAHRGVGESWWPKDARRDDCQPLAPLTKRTEPCDEQALLDEAIAQFDMVSPQISQWDWVNHKIVHGMTRPKQGFIIGYMAGARRGPTASEIRSKE